VDFALTDHTSVSPWVEFLWVLLALALPVGIAMLFWLRRRARHARDVLSSSATIESD
jgi:hypothetical protein